MSDAVRPALGGIVPIRTRGAVPGILLIAAVAFLAGTIWKPPLGGLLALVILASALLAIALLVARPGLFLAIFLVFATVAPFLSRVAHLPLGWFKGGFFLLILPLWILSRAAARGDRRWIESARTPLLLYAASAAVLLPLAILSLARGVSFLLVVSSLRGYLLYPPLLFVALEAAEKREDVRRFLRLTLVLTAAVAAGAALQTVIPLEWLLRRGISVETGSVVFLSIDPVTGKFFQRVFSILDDQSSVAAFAFVGIVISLYMAITARRRRDRIWILAALAANAYALILTYNMTTLSGTVLFVLILILRRRSARLLLAFLAVVAVVGGIAWLRYGELIGHRLATSFTTKAGVSTSLAARIVENRNAIRMLKEQPLLGQGLGATANAGIYYRLGMRSTMEGGISADDFFMTTALEGGLIGLAAVLLLDLLPLIGLRRFARSRDPADRTFQLIMGSAVVVLLLMNFSNGPMNTNPTNLLYWSLAGLAWRGPRA